MATQRPFPTVRSFRPPGGVVVQPRRFELRELGSVPEYWLGDNPILTHVENVFSVLIHAGVRVAPVLALVFAILASSARSAHAQAFETADFLYVGSELLFVGSPTTPGVGYDISLPFADTVDLALSGDGSAVWFLVLDFAFGADPTTRYQVFSMRTDGSDVRQSGLFLADGGIVADLLTTEGGEAGVLDLRYVAAVPGPFPPTEHRFMRAARGNAFGINLDTFDVDDPDLGPFGAAESIHPNLTDDGEALYFAQEPFIWKTPLNPGMNPFQVGEAEKISFGTLDLLNGFDLLDITGNGGEWITTLEFDREGPDEMQLVVTGMSIPVTSIENAFVGARNPTPPQIDDAGEVVTFCEGVIFEQTCVVGNQGGVQRTIVVPIGEPRFVGLADGGGVFYAPLAEAGSATTYGDMLESVDGGARVAATSGFFSGAFEGSFAISDDGRVLAATVPVPGTGIEGLAVAFPGRAVLPDLPRIEDIRYRYDESGNLVVRARVTSPDGFWTITARPLYDRIIDPVYVFDQEVNPFYFVRFGRPLFPVPGEPDTFEATLFLDGKKDLIDASFTLRLYAANAGRNRVAFADFHPSPDGAPPGFAPNDACLTPAYVPGDSPVPWVAALDTTVATAADSDPATSCSGFALGSTVWYTLTLDEAGPVSISTDGSDYDTIVSVWLASEGCGDLVTEVACDDDGGEGVQSEAVFDAEAGVTYVVQIGAFNGGDGGNLQVSVVPEPGPVAALTAAFAVLAVLRRGRRARVVTPVSHKPRC